MMRSYVEVVKQIDQLTEEAERLRLNELAGVIERMKQEIAVYRLTAEDLGLVPARDEQKYAAFGYDRRSTLVRFRDDAGHTWVGRGPRPQWLREALANGKHLKDFAV